jgi:eukaryotic-like serine/threonine-protein kinase
MICPRCRKRYVAGVRTCPTDEATLVRIETADQTDPMIGRNLDGRFTVLSQLGAGSMGTVYRARQHAMGREVAIKILRSDRAVDESAKGRFLREARANSLLASPHTVTVFDFGETAGGELFLAMELLDGESLGQRMARLGRLPADAAVDTVRQALRSLAEAHAKGIIHRDLKPDNLFYARVATGGQTDEIVKVLDFGVAKMMGVGAGPDGEPINAVETQAGTVFGTPRYMSPEQAQGKTLDARSDLYSLGVILYHMLTGRPPFTDDDAVVVMARHIKTAAVPPSTACPDARVAPELEALLMRLLSKDPAQRPYNSEAMLEELARLDESALAGTSGVRASVTPNSTVMRTASPGGSRAPGQRQAPREAASLSDANAAPSNATMQAAGLRPKRSSRSVIAIVVVALLLGVVAVSALPRATVSDPPATSTSPDTPKPPADTPKAQTRPTSVPDIPPPDVPAAAKIPSIAADDLPRAPGSAASPPDTPRGAQQESRGGSRHRGHAPAAPSASSSHYGYLE